MPSTTTSSILALLATSATVLGASASGVNLKRQAAEQGLTLNATAHIQGEGGITGTINFVADPETEVVTVQVNINGLQEFNETSTYPYHVHTNPIPSSGDCKGAFGHLDPLHLTDAIVCDPAQPQRCQEGDLAGKHGRLNGTDPTFSATYQDPYLRFWPEPLSILGRSVVIHLPNSTRIACGNITSQLDGTEDANGVPTNASSTYVTNYPLAGGPPVSSFVTLFQSGTTVSPAPSEATVPGILPDVTQIPNAVATTATELTTQNGQAISTGIPAVVSASGSFVYSGQGASAFPTQSEALYATMPRPSSASSASGSAASASGTSGTTSGAGRVATSVGALLAGLAFALTL